MDGLSILFIFFYIYLFVAYCFLAYGLHRIAIREGEKNAWIAYVPILNFYLLGKIAFNSKVHGVIYFIVIIAALLVPLCAKYLLIIYQYFINALESNRFLLLLFAFTNPVLEVIIICCWRVYMCVVHYKLYQKYAKSAVIMAILDAVTGGSLAPFFIFAIRNNEKKLT